MAEDAIDAAIKAHNLKAGPSRTVGLFLQGGKDWSPTLYIRLVQDYGLESEVSVIAILSYFLTNLTIASNRISSCDLPDLEFPFAAIISVCVLWKCTNGEKEKGLFALVA